MNHRLTFILALLLLSYAANAQNRGDIRIMTYNTENLYDTEDDPLTTDDDFTPEGRLHWTPEKYRHKLLNIYKVIAGVGEWQPPEIIGLVEIENQKVINDLITTTPLLKFKYGIVHYESPDPRGIDVCLLYRSDKFKVLDQEPIRISFIGQPERKTRDILYVKLLLENSDTLCIFVNHWPSRRGGEIVTEDLRFEAASMLRQKVDLLFKSSPSTKIIIMGDFNDEPTDQSLTEYLKAQPVSNLILTSKLYNLSLGLPKISGIGTHYFRGHWSILDQMVVSGNLLNAAKGLATKPTDIHIFAADFIVQSDKKNLSIKPLPTYSGPRYLGGFSDHLPVYLDLYVKK